MKTKILRPILACIAFIALVTPAMAKASESEQPQVIGLMFYADTCGSCKILDPKVEAAQQSFANDPVLFLTFDHSNPASQKQAALLAEAVGLASVYSSEKKASGFMLLVDPKSQQVLARITRSMSETDIQATIQSALEQSA